MSRLWVSVAGTRVGGLVQNRSEGHFFEPDREWLDGGQRPVLSLCYLQELNRRSTPRRSSHLPLWFENLLPERDSELRRLLCRHFELTQGQSFKLLEALGADLPGAVVIEPDKNGGEPPADDEPIARQGDPLRFSLAGAQLKFSVAKQGTRFTLPARGSGGSWIIKVPGDGMDLLPTVELCTMRWARAAGLPVPDCEVTPIDSIQGLDAFVRQGVRDVFAVRRYDRAPGGARIHQEDFAQVLNLAPEHKYGETGQPRATVATVARVIRDACGSNELDGLLDRVAFVVASGNGDAHLKNWSLVYPAGAGIPRLAPCYDQVCSIACDPARFGWASPEGPMLGLKLGHTRSFRSLGRADVQLLARQIGRAPSQLEDRFIGSLQRFRGAFAAVAADAPSVMQRALGDHWEKVPLLAALGGWKR
ncbi:MAG: HipA domain-containing protein [Polyangiaceae bacterium]|nr:HipA domain-containing protein [Polyangiaceae bacterium]